VVDEEIMSAQVSDFAEFIKEQLATVSALATTRFFGGIGLTSDGVQFGMMMGDLLYFVVDNTTRPHYQQQGSNCFSYSTKKGVVNVNRYFEVPAQAIEEPDQLVALATEAIAVARGSKDKQKKRV
jgi:DNA transformation protein and related proteins